MKARYKITVERTIIEECEVGRQYHNTHKKDADGNEIWDYTPSQFGMKENTRVLFQSETSAMDTAALARLLSRMEKNAPKLAGPEATA